MLNRFRVGIKSDEDTALMKTRVFQRYAQEVPDDRVSIFATNAEVKMVNELSLELLDSEEYQSEAIVEHKTLKNYKPASFPSQHMTFCRKFHWILMSVVFCNVGP